MPGRSRASGASSAASPWAWCLRVAAWNYPYLIAVNSVVPALLAGNAVVLKHSAQTPLCGERFAECFAAAGLPAGVFTLLHLEHADTERVIRDPRVDFVAFTGSVAGGRSVQRVAAERFIGVGLELGGCDPVYVRHDADLPHAIENIVDGAYFNSGQSCCGLQRIYVHESVHERFTRGCIELIQQYRLGDPLAPETTLGPVVRTAAAEAIRAQVHASIAAGARAAIEERDFPRSQPGTPYLAPQLLLDAPAHSPVMREEIFGPVAGVMKVRSDAEAVAQMNDSAFGLTAAVWTRDTAAAVALGEQVQTGTWFMNRCDYLDPALAWAGVKRFGAWLYALGSRLRASDAAEIISLAGDDVSAILKANWNYPTTVWAGPGRIAELPAACARLSIRRPLLVTDEGLRDAPMVRRAGELVPGSALFARVRGNPVAANIEEGLAAYRAGGHDGVIAFGGGSALDAGKVIAFMSGQTRPLWDFEDVGDWWTRADPRGIAPIVAVPTTAGTGSEVGRAGVVVNEATHQKKIIFHPQMMPGVVISDPELTLGLPPAITAATGMDAFVHCFEAFCAPGFHPLADGIALEGMRLIQRYLPRACDDGQDIEARSRMLAAASMGATAFQKGLGGVHAIAHPVGAHFNTHHGLTNAVLLPYLLVHNRRALETQLPVIARTLNLDGRAVCRGVRLGARLAQAAEHSALACGDRRHAAQPRHHRPRGLARSVRGRQSQAHRRGGLRPHLPLGSEG